MGIADRYLAHLAMKGQQAPLLSHLTVISLLLAIKLNEPICPPTIQFMVNILNSWDSKHAKVADLVTLERQVLKALDFDFEWPTPAHYIPRF